MTFQICASFPKIRNLPKIFLKVLRMWPLLTKYSKHQKIKKSSYSYCRRHFLLDKRFIVTTIIIITAFTTGSYKSKQTTSQLGTTSTHRHHDVCCMGTHHLCGNSSWWRLKPIKLVFNPIHLAGWLALLVVFHWLVQYASSPGNRTWTIQLCRTCCFFSSSGPNQ